jgi:thioredoxin reductase (NADPH)
VSAATAPGRIHLTLYSRRYCHLCDDMFAALNPLASDLGFEIEVVDVDRCPELERRYGEFVPLLAHGDTRICHYLLDNAALTAYLSAFR